MQSPVTVSPLDAFLGQSDIEGSPAWEFISGQAVQKTIPALFHSRIQRNLMNVINARTEQYEALQEFRCIVPPLSPVPDICVIAVERLVEVNGPFVGAPDWTIEILSPEQSTLETNENFTHAE